MLSIFSGSRGPHWPGLPSPFGRKFHFALHSLPDDGRSISRNVANINKLVQDKTKLFFQNILQYRPKLFTYISIYLFCFRQLPFKYLLKKLLKFDTELNFWISFVKTFRMISFDGFWYGFVCRKGIRVDMENSSWYKTKNSAP